MRRTAVLAGGMLLAAMLVLLAVWAQPVFASTSQVGKNIGDEVKGLATALFLAVAALVAIPVLTRRDVSGGLVIALLVVVLGGFIFAPGSVKQVIVELWKGLVG